MPLIHSTSDSLPPPHAHTHFSQQSPSGPPLNTPRGLGSQNQEHTHLYSSRRMVSPLGPASATPPSVSSPSYSQGGHHKGGVYPRSTPPNPSYFQSHPHATNSYANSQFNSRNVHPNSGNTFFHSNRNNGGNNKSQHVYSTGLRADTGGDARHTVSNRPDFQQEQQQQQHNPHRFSQIQPPYRARFSHPESSRTPSFNVFSRQSQHLEELAVSELVKSEMSDEEKEKALQFRLRLQNVISQGIKSAHPDFDVSVELRCFGSFAAGFAVSGSDMDLSFIATGRHADRISPEVPRLLEKILLDAGIGARLIDKTRIPILKVCESPSEELLSDLRQERATYEQALKKTESQQRHQNHTSLPPPSNRQPKSKEAESLNPAHRPKSWLRQRSAGPLEYPKTGAGVLCDINFTNRLALENTELLRCYSLCDPRVGQMIRFVKTWAKRRKINSSYCGTLSSYGYVLMVLHYLINIATPPVLPNLQFPHHHTISLDRTQGNQIIEGYDTTFFRDENVLCSLANSNALTANVAPLGVLLRNFFHYYAFQGHSVVHNGFNWGRNVVSIRTPGGLLAKDQKGWTSARTTTKNETEVRIRYLLALEDPFETDHNVARTVTYHGMRAIRDEFKRAWWYLEAIGYDQPVREALLAELVEDEPAVKFDPTPAPGPSQARVLHPKPSSTGTSLNEHTRSTPHVSSLPSHHASSECQPNNIDTVVETDGQPGEFGSKPGDSRQRDNQSDNSQVCSMVGGLVADVNELKLNHSVTGATSEQTSESQSSVPQDGVTDLAKRPYGWKRRKQKLKEKRAAERAAQRLEAPPSTSEVGDLVKKTDALSGPISSDTVSKNKPYSQRRGNSNKGKNARSFQNTGNASVALPTPSPSMESSSPPDLSNLPNTEEIACAYAVNAVLEGEDDGTTTDPPAKKFVFSQAANPTRRFKPGVDYSIYTEPVTKQSTYSYPYTTPPNFEVSPAYSFTRPRRNNVRFAFSKGDSKNQSGKTGLSGQPGSEAPSFKRQFHPARDDWKPEKEFVDGARGGGPGSGYSGPVQPWRDSGPDGIIDW